MNLLSAYSSTQIASLILVPSLSVLLVIVIMFLLFGKNRASGLITAHMYLSKTAKILKNTKSGETDKAIKKIAAHLDKAQFAAENVTERQKYDLTPLLSHLDTACKVANAVKKAQSTDKKYFDIIENEVTSAREFLRDICGVSDDINLRRAAKAHEKAAATKYLESLDK